MKNSPKPTTFKDILKQNTQKEPGHVWQIIGGGRKSNIRSWNPNIPPQDERVYILYKCNKCKIKARKYTGEEIEAENDEYDGLTCNEVIIRQIRE